MLKILMISEFYPPRVGGVEKFVKILSEGLSARGHQCTVLCTGKRDEERLESGVRIIQMANYPMEFHGINLRFGKKMRKLITECDIVHINSFYPILANVAARICLKYGKPYLFSSHYHGQGHTWMGNILFRVYRPLTRKMFREASLVHCCSKYEMDLIHRDFEEDLRIEVISDGAEHLFLEPRNRNGRLLFIGRMESYKGPQRVLQIIENLRERGRIVGLDMVGSGPLRKPLEERVEQYNLQEQVTFHSRLSDDELLRMIRQASLSILLSDAEAYGLVVSESLSNGTPCLVSDRMALVEFENEPGCFIHRGEYDLNTLSDTVEMILDTAPVVGPLTDKIPTLEKMIIKFEDTYSDILAQAKNNL